MESVCARGVGHTPHCTHNHHQRPVIIVIPLSYWEQNTHFAMHWHVYTWQLCSALFVVNEIRHGRVDMASKPWQRWSSLYTNDVYTTITNTKWEQNTSFCLCTCIYVLFLMMMTKVHVRMYIHISSNVVTVQFPQLMHVIMFYTTSPLIIHDIFWHKKYAMLASLL